MLTFWGEQFRSYFLDFCAASLLAPHNLPLLSKDDGNKLFLATTDEDWRAIESLPITRQLAQYVTPVHVRIAQQPEYSNYANSISQEQASFKKLLEAAYSTEAYGCLLSPDCLISDGMIESLLQRARDGCQLVLCPNLRLAEHSTLSEVGEFSIVSSGPESPDEVRKLAIPKRALAGIAARHIHPRLIPYEEGAAGQPRCPPFRLWRSGQGIIMHGYFGTPVLMDFSVVPADHIACLDGHHTFESTYLSKNFADCARIHVVRSPDEFVLSSLASEANWDVESKISPTHYRSLCSIRRSYAVFTKRGKDRVRSETARSLSVWHQQDKDDDWLEWEQKIYRLLEEAVGDFWHNKKALRRDRPDRATFASTDGASNQGTWSLAKSLWPYVGLGLLVRVHLTLGDPLYHLWIYRGAISRRIGQLFSGDRAAWRRVWERTKLCAACDERS
jgi:hypothetical protein